MNEQRRDPGREAQRVVDGLAELFDGAATTDRVAAEEELREAGLDPAAVGQRLRRVAQHGLAAAMTPAVGAAPVRHLRDGSEGRTLRAQQPQERDHGVGWHWRRYLAPLAAGVLIGAGITTVWMRLGNDRPAQQAAQHASVAGQRTNDTAKPVVRRSDDGEDLSATEHAQLGTEEDGATVPCGPAHPGFDARTGRCAGVSGSQRDPARPGEAQRGPGHAAAVEPAPSDTHGLEGKQSGQPETESRVGAAVPLAGAAQTEPWMLNRSNWEKAKGLLPDPVLNRVRSGDYWFHVVPLQANQLRQNYSRQFREASKANAGRYGVDEETCGLKDVASGKMPEFYFGYPFPQIEHDDPRAACKIAWNVEAATSMGEGQGATVAMNGVSAEGEFKRLQLSLHVNPYLGRHGGPVANPENLRSASISTLIDPLDLDGVAGLTKRLNDWHSQDQIWSYAPATRRVRRLNSATRSDPIAGLDLFGDDVNCYAGKIESYEWKLIGEGNILAPVVAPRPLLQEPTDSPSRFNVRIPSLRAAYEMPGTAGAPWLIAENFVLALRPVWILEGRSRDPYYDLGKSVMYVDRDLYRIYWKLVYNRQGEYFYNAMCAYHWSRNAEGTFSAVTPSLIVGVNDRANRAALWGRYTSHFIERAFPLEHFSLNELTRRAD